MGKFYNRNAISNAVDSITDSVERNHLDILNRVKNKTYPHLFNADVLSKWKSSINPTPTSLSKLYGIIAALADEHAAEKEKLLGYVGDICRACGIDFDTVKAEAAQIKLEAPKNAEEQAAPDAGKEDRKPQRPPTRATRSGTPAEMIRNR